MVTIRILIVGEGHELVSIRTRQVHKGVSDIPRNILCSFFMVTHPDSPNTNSKQRSRNFLLRQRDHVRSIREKCAAFIVRHCPQNTFCPGILASSKKYLDCPDFSLLYIVKNAEQTYEWVRIKTALRSKRPHEFFAQ